MKKSQLALVVASLAGVMSATAQPATWTPDPQFPDYWQLAAGVNDPNEACAEVAATDSLEWLSSTYNLPNLVQGQTWQGLANTLEEPQYMDLNGGTYSGDFVNGKIAYINSVGYANRLVVESQLGGEGTVPTISWIEQQVAARQDVEIEVGWIETTPSGPDLWLNGHYVAVTGYNQNNLLIADPWTGPGANNAESLQIDGTVATELNFDAYGNQIPNYTLDYPEVTINDGISYANADYEIIFAAVSESVPEPSALSLIGMGGMALAAFLRRCKA